MSAWKIGCASFLKLQIIPFFPPRPAPVGWPWQNLKEKWHLDCHLSHSGTQEIKAPQPQVNALLVKALGKSVSLHCCSTPLVFCLRGATETRGCPCCCTGDQHFRNQSLRSPGIVRNPLWRKILNPVQAYCRCLSGTGCLFQAWGFLARFYSMPHM